MKLADVRWNRENRGAVTLGMLALLSFAPTLRAVDFTPQKAERDPLEEGRAQLARGERAAALMSAKNARAALTVKEGEEVEGSLRSLQIAELFGDIYSSQRHFERALLEYTSGIRAALSIKSVMIPGSQDYIELHKHLASSHSQCSFCYEALGDVTKALEHAEAAIHDNLALSLNEPDPQLISHADGLRAVQLASQSSSAAFQSYWSMVETNLLLTGQGERALAMLGLARATELINAPKLSTYSPIPHTNLVTPNEELKLNTPTYRIILLEKQRRESSGDESPILKMDETTRHAEASHLLSQVEQILRRDTQNNRTSLLELVLVQKARLEVDQTNVDALLKESIRHSVIRLTGDPSSLPVSVVPLIERLASTPRSGELLTVSSDDLLLRLVATSATDCSAAPSTDPKRLMYCLEQCVLQRLSLARDLFTAGKANDARLEIIKLEKLLTPIAIQHPLPAATPAIAALHRELDTALADQDKKALEGFEAILKAKKK